MRNGFFMGHGLGNDYIVVDPGELEFRLTPNNVRLLCDRHLGVGADGVLAMSQAHTADFGVRIFNPDGSEAEKSGNGLRIFSRFLYATRRTQRTAFRVATKGGVVGVQLHVDAHGDASSATIEMGTASFRPSDLPCSLRVEELVDRPVRAAGRRLHFTGVSLGNPHCVIFPERNRGWSRKDLLELGPALENHALFPRRSNVQLARRTGPRAIEILIWERGVGETRASGTSACAAACAALRLGLVRSPVRVRAPGGDLRIEIDGAWNVTMQGPVEEVARGRFSPAFVRLLR